MKLKNLLLSLILLCAVITPASALVKYDVLFTDAEVFVNSTVKFTSDSEVDIWDLTLKLPKHSEIISLSDEEPIFDYTFDNGELRFKTNRDNIRFSETVNVYYRDLDALDRTHYPLKIGKASLFGFEDEFTEVTVRAQDLNSGSLSLGFEPYFEEDVMKGLGKGAVNVNIVYGARDFGEYEHYVPYTTLDLTKADLMYGMLPQLTGYDVPFEKFVVVGLEDREYSEVVDRWSDGRYEGGGLIYIREDDENIKHYTAVVLHETVHGINAEVMKWDLTEVAWFDEGIAKYVEYLVNNQLDNLQPEIFGEDVSEFSGLTKYTYLSRGTSDELWDYYHNGGDFMRTWNPDVSEHRDFGYAFGELVIRDFVRQDGIEGLHRVYDILADIDKKVDDVDERNQIILNAMSSDFRPCYSRDRAAFEACLREANTFVPEIPLHAEVKKMLLEEEELSKILELEETEIEKAQQRPSTFLQKFLNWLAEILS